MVEHQPHQWITVRDIPLTQPSQYWMFLLGEYDPFTPPVY